MVMTVILSAVLVSALGRVLADDMKEWMPYFRKKIVALAVRFVPVNCRDRYLEEWESDLVEVPGELAKLSYAVGLILAALGISVTWRVEIWREEMGLFIKAVSEVPPIKSGLALARMDAKLRDMKLMDKAATELLKAAKDLEKEDSKTRK
jgi:hypothetical protein